MKNILIVEDDPDHQELINASLTGHAGRLYRWTFRSSFSTAGEHLGENATDLILLDLSLPDSPYNETLPRMLEVAGNIPIIVLTSLDDRHTIMSMIQQGAKDCIPKSMLSGLFLERSITYCLDREEINRESLRKERRLVYESGFRKLVENNRSGIAVTSFEGTIFESNSAIREFLQIKADIPGGARLHDFLPPETGQTLTEAIRPLVEGRLEEISLEIEFGLGDGSTFYGEAVIQKADWLDHGPALIFSLQDLRRRKRAEAELKTALERVREESRTKSELISMLGHDIRTPLCNIISVVEYLHLVGPGNDDEGYLDTVDQLARNVLCLIDNILVDVRSEPGDMTLHHSSCRIQTLLENMLKLYRVQADNKSIDLQCKVDLEDPVRAVDKGRLEQILNNLLANAFKFTPKGGTIRVEVSGEGDVLRFSVADTGIGINPGEQEKLFQPFSQANASIQRDYGGTGLGLSICRKLCERMGGSISLESEPGKGSTFHFEIRCPENV